MLGSCPDHFLPNTLPFISRQQCATMVPGAAVQKSRANDGHGTHHDQNGLYRRYQSLVVYSEVLKRGNDLEPFPELSLQGCRMSPPCLGAEFPRSAMQSRAVQMFITTFPSRIQCRTRTFRRIGLNTWVRTSGNHPNWSSTVVKALYLKPEGRGFETRWVEWFFQLT
jgi:hypothetical protein